MKQNYFSDKAINCFIQHLKIGKHLDWPIIGLVLLSAEHHQLWLADFKSFTAWVRIFSGEIKKQESTCWRYLTATKFYIQLKEILDDNGIQCPVITDLREDISPENIELLEKLHRVMPHDQFLNYAQGTIKNTIKRKELREAWSIYRPLLQGRTARGVKVAPKINTTDKLQFDNQAEAIAMTSLINSDGSWAKKKKSDIYKTFRGFNIPVNILGNNHTFELDLFVLTGSKKSSELLIHFVEYTGFINNQHKIEQLLAASKKVNFTWIMFQTESNIQVEAIFPAAFGLIALSSPDNFNVQREATYNEIDQSWALKQIVLSCM